jgi:nucleoid-associated protein YgaU
MKDTPTKVFGLLCVLVAVWTAVYWLYEPGEPPVTFARSAGDAADAARSSGPVRDPMAELSPPIGSGANGADGSSAARPPVGAAPERRTVLPPAPVKPSAEVRAAPPTAPATRVVPPEYWEYTVQKGDGSMEAIARRLLGDGRLWTKIAEANPLLDARKLIPGRTKLKIPRDITNIQGKEVPIVDPLPPAAAPAPAGTGSTPAPAKATAAERTYVVKAGDTLSDIAREVYGKSSLWLRIYEANTDVIDNPDAVKPGTTLRIPAAE